MTKQRVVQQDHAHLGAGLDGRVDAERFVFANQVADGRVAHQQFVRGDAAAADLGNQRLRKHADDRGRKLRANLILLARGEHVDDAVDRALGAGGVQRAEHDVARFGGADGRLDRGQIAQLAHEDDVGVLRSARRRASEKLGTSTPISRWLTVDFLFGWKNSIGSSIVMM